MQCETKKENGVRCNNHAMNGDVCCYWHSLKIPEDEKNKKRAKGGRNKILEVVQTNFPKFKLNTVRDVMRLNSLMINSVLHNELDLRISTGLAYLLTLQLRCLELSNLEGRITKLESTIAEDFQNDYNDYSSTSSKSIN
jgi:hypothetical protein